MTQWHDFERLALSRMLFLTRYYGCGVDVTSTVSLIRICNLLSIQTK